MSMRDNDNWLDSKEIECVQCAQKLHWLRHSPMYNAIFFYCTQCPMRIDISYSDEGAIKLRHILEATVGERQTNQFSTRYIDLIEQNLMPCNCGGKFTYDAPRRCLRCFAILPQSEPGRDVFPPESPNQMFSPEYQSLGSPTRSLIKTGIVWKVRS